MLEYYREYRSLAHMAFDYEISEPTASRIIKEVETVLIHSGKFSLPGKKHCIKKEELNLNILSLMRPNAQCNAQKRQWRCYSGKKKRHMLKGQIVINQYGHIVCTAISTRTMHDFKLFKKSRLPIKKETKVSVDTGYLGITSLHPNTDIPKKKVSYIHLP